MLIYKFQISQGVFTPGGCGDFYPFGDIFDDFMEACFKFVEICNVRAGYNISRYDTLDTILEVNTYDSETGDLVSCCEGILYTQFNRRGRLVSIAFEDVVPDLIVDKIQLKEE